MIERLDNYVTQCFSRFSHRVQRTTGYTNYTLAAGSAFVSCIGQVIVILKYWWPDVIPTSPSDQLLAWFGFLIIVNLAVCHLPRLMRNEERVYANKLPEYIPDSPLFLRMFWGLTLPISIVFFSMDHAYVLPLVHAFRICGLSFGEWARLYFLRVVPLPPGRVGVVLVPVRVS